MTSSKQLKTISNLSIIYGSVLLVFFLGLILFGPENLSEYKHNLIAIISSLLVGIFGFFISGDIGITINSDLVNNKIGKIAIQASGGAALFVLSMIWWKSPVAPISKHSEEKIIQQQKDSEKQTGDKIDSSTSYLQKTVETEAERTRTTVIDASISELEGTFALVSRIETDVDGTMIRLQGEGEVPLISYDNNLEQMKLRWGDRIHYYIFHESNSSDTIGECGLSLKLSNGKILALEKGGSKDLLVPGHDPRLITARILNPCRLRDVSIKLTVYSTDRERGRERFKEALMNTPLSSGARKVYKQIKIFTDLKNAPSNGALTLRKLDKGTYVRVLQDSNGYSHIRMPEGRKGWVKSNLIIPIVQ
ncbi:hypothetical protein [Flavobacterium coralii]|uniref:SH3 domain-containing protein n=1 Tax=Flavobacterium coralii TaxID=2838017 RepID=UPI000C36DF30|nr:hypothetical protein [Flavobacterium sp.]|tara:strand:+ start:4907 stop:5995 length:1089 start_codon:yes stop_codon:yes gene_type:complete